ncbi:MAG: hypothetical protein ACI8Y9_000810, partial [Paracoccaceae bacterium]
RVISKRDVIARTFTNKFANPYPIVFKMDSTPCFLGF